MYEKLIERLREYPDREETVGGYVEIDWQDLLDAADAIESLTAQLAALQSENAELREKNGCLQHNVAAMQATLDQQAKNCEELLAEKDKEIKYWKEEADNWKILRKDADRIREGMMSREVNLISKNVKLESALSRVTAERDQMAGWVDLFCEMLEGSFGRGTEETTGARAALAEIGWRGAQGEV